MFAPTSGRRSLAPPWRWRDGSRRQPVPRRGIAARGTLSRGATAIQNQPIVQSSRSNRPRTNRGITAREVRVIGPGGEQLGILPTPSALGLALEQGLDLVEVDPRASPPVCRVLDAGRQRYAEAKGRTAVRTTVKEVQLRPGTGPHDLQIKVDCARRFLAVGARVQVVVRFRGRELRHPERGRDVLDRLVAAPQGVGVASGASAVEARRLCVTLAPAP